MSSIVETTKTSMDNTDVLKNEIAEMQKEHDTNANEIEELYEVIEGLEEEKKELQEEIERLKSGGAKEEPVEKKDAKKEFAELFEKMYQLSLDNNWGDTFSYNRAREIHMANYLGHSVALNYSGADAIDQDGLEVEYKSTISKDIQATYNGISVHHNWESQETYIREHKIGKYKKALLCKISRFTNCRNV